jgi:lysophospholipase L1-like esterase
MRILRALLSTVTLLLLVASTATAAEPVEVNSTRIMIVGSSTSHGSGGDYTWRYRLWKRLQASDVVADFVGPNNRVYDSMRSQAEGAFVESNAYADPDFDRDHNARWGRLLGNFAGQYGGAKDSIGSDVATFQPQYVIVMLGLNDLTLSSARLPSQVAGDMAAFIANSRAARSDVDVLMVGVQPTKIADDNAALGARVAEYNRLLGELASSQSTAGSRVVYVPPAANYEPNFNETQHDSYDGTHPNAHGEIKIANAVADSLAVNFGLGSLHPGVPTGPVLAFTLRCAPGNSKVVLTWDESPGATAYRFQRRIAGRAWEPAVYQVTMADQPLDNVWLYNDVTYEYRLQAVKWYDEGVYSNVCAATPRA